MNEICGKTLKMQQKFIEQFKKLFTEDGYFTETEEGNLKPSTKYENKIGWDNEEKHIKIVYEGAEVDLYGVNLIILQPIPDGVTLRFVVSSNDGFEATEQTVTLPSEGMITILIFSEEKELSRKGIFCVGNIKRKGVIGK